MKNLYTLFFFVTLLTGANFLANAQSGKGTLEGRVSDGQTGELLVSASVVLSGPTSTKGTTTNTAGFFQIKGIEEGQYTLAVSYLGFEKSVLAVSINSGAVTTQNLALQPAPASLNSVEIIGSRPGVEKTLPGTASKISQLELRRINPIGTQELFTHIPGVFAAADDGFGNSRMSIGIRGLNPRRSSRVLILEDGIPIQPALYVYPLMYYNPPVERLDEVEVIKGSGAIKFGPQTMGGVVNYITKRPREVLGGSVQSVVGNNGYHSIFTEVGGFGNAKVRPELQLIYKGGDGFRQNNDFTQYNATAKLHLLPSATKNYYLKANFNYENSNATYTGLTEYSFKNNPNFNPKKHDNFEVYRGALDLIVTDQLTDKLSVTTKGYATWFKRDWWREDDVFVRAETYNENEAINPVPYDTPGNLIRVGNGRTNYGNLRTFYTAGLERNYHLQHKLFGKESSLAFGGRVHWERFKDERRVGNKPDARENEALLFIHNPATGLDSVFGKAENWQTAALALYVQEEIKLTQKLTVSPGVRFETFEQERIDLLAGSKYQDKVSAVVLPGVGLNYGLGRYNVFAGIHRGYTPPSSSTLANLNFNQAFPGQTASALDVKPEKSWNTELGIRGSGKYHRLEVAVFHLSVEDMVAASNLAVFGNLGKVQSYGLESEMYLFPSRKFAWMPDVYFTGTLLQTEITDAVLKISALQTGSAVLNGNELPYAPRVSFTAGLMKQIGGKLNLSGEVQYVSQVYTDYENISFINNRGDTGPVQAYYLVNATAGYELNKHWRMFISGKNLLDTIYIASRLNSDASRPDQSFGLLPGARRQVNVGVVYQFSK